MRAIINAVCVVELFFADAEAIAFVYRGRVRR